jgi:hypothetical protein
MASDPMETKTSSPTKLFGLRKESRQADGPFAVTEEATAWEIYNHKVSKIDRELIKDWNDSLNTLLIFVRCFLGPRSIDPSA